MRGPTRLGTAYGATGLSNGGALRYLIPTPNELNSLVAGFDAIKCSEWFGMQSGAASEQYGNRENLLRSRAIRCKQASAVALERNTSRKCWHSFRVGLSYRTTYYLERSG